jgi:murein DD-endopeptidase MepM/ murein hydrolase activator NlpD
MRRLVLVALLAGCGTVRQGAGARDASRLAAPRPTGAPPVEELRLPLAAAAACSRGFLPGERHFAIDLPAPEGTPVLAAARGVVVRASHHPQYGLSAILLHPGLQPVTYTLYAHLSRLLVAAGDEVEAGAEIGEVGDTGNARGAHLHWEILRAPQPLPIRPEGALGLPGDAYRLDPAGLVAGLPPTCGPAASR